MKKAFLALVLLCPALLLTSCNSRNEFFVASHGSDGNSGTRAKPFATITKAKDAVREALEKNGIADITVWISGGTYHIESPLLFNPEDSGNDTTRITYRALPGHTPVISGGVELKNWKEGPDGIWSAPLPEPFSSFAPRELFINRKRAVRARTPNEGFLRIKKAGKDKRTSFYYENGDFSVPENPEDVEIVLLHDWSISRIKVKEIDPGEREITALDSIGAKALDFFTIDNWEPHPRYYLENSVTFLDAENEWFCDESEKTVYLKPPAGTRPGETAVTIPFSGGLMLIQGTVEQPVRNIHFEGITFSHCSWQLPKNGYSGIQATQYDPRPDREQWAVVEAAVQAAWAENCSFRDCEFSQLGGSGLWLGVGNKNCLVTGSLFTDISGNGIMIGEGRDRGIDGEPWWKASPEQAAVGNSIENCTVTGCGKQFFGAVGIWCGLTAETIISGNEISNLPYTGISVGWMWDPQPTPCRDNRIEGNHIHHILQVLSDGGGIYMLGLQPNSRLVNNHIHDVKINAGRAESNGMFIDEGSTDLLIADNLIYNIASSPLRFHKATTNLVRGNYLFCSGDNPPVRYNSTKEKDIRKQDNHIFRESDENYSSRLKKIRDEWNKAGGNN